MKNQALFSSKDKSKKFKCRLLQFLFGALRVNMYITSVFLHFACHHQHSETMQSPTTTLIPLLHEQIVKTQISLHICAVRWESLPVAMVNSK